MTTTNRESVLSQVSESPQNYPSEYSAIERFLKTARDLVSCGDLRTILAQYITQFLKQLDTVTQVVKSKGVSRLIVEDLKGKISEFLETYGYKLMELLKEIILVRQRDRTMREMSLRAVKRLFKMSTTQANIADSLYKIKLHVVVTFILEREFKSSAVAKERN